MSYINNYNINLYRKWLLLGISALAISGILSIFIVLLRLPISKSFFVDVNRIFDTSLVIHVNLSVLVWGCSIISMISSFLISNSKYSRYFKYLCYSAFTGTLLMLLSVFFQNAEPIKNNYIPIINNQYFLLGLLTFIMSILCYSILSTKCHGSKILKGIALGVHGTSIILTCAILCFSMSYYTIHTQKYSPVLFYEYMFWGGGHVLQLAFSQTLLLVYLIILEQKSKFLKGTTVNIIFIVNTLSTIFTPLVYICAILLFNYGGILGILSIQGNVTIPAHYHGSIVGMTIAFMGLIYWIIPKIGFYKINTTIANIQIYTYSLGQFLHITGLELLGGYGAIRKVTHLPDTASKIAQHCFTFGGLMAIIGGCLFVILVLLQVCKKRSHI
ncbi:hypothetical protein [Ehrlichia ruminantium]|nr:hypothetical protein [Ehrlichia ruminantium]